MHDSAGLAGSALRNQWSHVLEDRCAPPMPARPSGNVDRRQLREHSSRDGPSMVLHHDGDINVLQPRYVVFAVAEPHHDMVAPGLVPESPERVQTLRSI